MTIEHVMDDHDWTEWTEWHHPPGDESEWRERRCQGPDCTQEQVEGRDLTGLDDDVASIGL